MDIVDAKTRSRMMAGVGNANTAPEIIIRKALHASGFRYRTHDRRYPGKPDIVLPKYRAIINVNGCFWHGHECYLFKLPDTKTDFWQNKIRDNVERDKRNLAALREAGWRVCVVWECAVKGAVHRDSIPTTIKVLSDWLKGSDDYLEIDGGASGQDNPRFSIS